MPINETLIGRKMYCVIDQKEIPPERLKHKAVTCSDECYELRNRMGRMNKDNRECRYCHKPSTPNRRKAFSRFNRWEKEHPELAYPDAWRQLEAAGMTQPEFRIAFTEALRFDVDLESPAEFNFGSMKQLLDERPGKRKMKPELTRAMEILEENYKARPAQEEAHAIPA